MYRESLFHIYILISNTIRMYFAEIKRNSFNFMANFRLALILFLKV